MAWAYSLCHFALTNGKSLPFMDDFPMNQGLAEHGAWTVNILRPIWDCLPHLIAKWVSNRLWAQSSQNDCMSSIIDDPLSIYLSTNVPCWEWLMVNPIIIHNLQRLLRSPSWDWSDSQTGFNCFCFKLTISCVADETSKSLKMMYDLLSLHIMYHV